MGKDPASGQARLDMFCSLMDEYDSLAEAFAVEQGPSTSEGRYDRRLTGGTAP
jgi:hypothetical protein